MDNSETTTPDSAPVERQREALAAIERERDGVFWKLKEHNDLVSKAQDKLYELQKLDANRQVSYSDDPIPPNSQNLEPAPPSPQLSDLSESQSAGQGFKTASLGHSSRDQDFLQTTTTESVHHDFPYPALDGASTETSHPSRRIPESRKTSGLDSPVRPGALHFKELFIQEHGIPGGTAARGPPIALLFNLDVPKFYRDELDATGSLLDLIVLTGAFNFWATTVGEYVDFLWPKSSKVIRQIFCQMCAPTPGNDTQATNPSSGTKNSQPIPEKDNKHTDRSQKRTQTKVKPLSEGSAERLPPDTTTSVAEKGQMKYQKSTTETQSHIASKFEVLRKMSSNEFQQPQWEIIPGSDAGLGVAAFRVRQDKDNLGHLMFLSGSISEQADLVAALGWLFLILHNSSQGPEDYVAQLKHGIEQGHAVYTFELQSIGPIRRHKGDCWLPLLPRTPCALEYASKVRSSEVYGLEVAFEMMCYLCGLEYEMIENGGVVLYGRHAVVYPVLKEGDYLRWHFEPCEPPCTPRSKSWGRRLYCDDLESLRGCKRHVLGLWEDPEVTLGTDLVDHSTLAYSSAQMMNEIRNKDGVSIGGSITAPKMFTVSWTQTYRVANSRRNQTMEHFEADLQRRKNSSVILYSPSQKTAWMVSFVSVLLQLVRHRAYAQRELGFHVPACPATADGGAASFATIRLNFRSPLKRPVGNEVLHEDELKYTVQNYVEEVLASLDLVSREAAKAKGVFRDRIVGYEFADIAKMKPRMTMRRSNLDAIYRGWSPLLDQVEFVLFYDGLLDPIVPSAASVSAWDRDGGLCSRTMWRNIPAGYNILTASMPCLEDLCEPFNHGQQHPNPKCLVSDYYWHRPLPELFALCGRERRHVCNRLQELKSNGSGTVTPVLTENQKKRAAVAFRYSTDMQKIQDNLDEINALATRRGVGDGQVAFHRTATVEDGGRSTGEQRNIGLAPIQRARSGLPTRARPEVITEDGAGDDGDESEDTDRPPSRRRETRRAPRPTTHAREGVSNRHAPLHNHTQRQQARPSSGAKRKVPRQSSAGFRLLFNLGSR